MIQLLKTNIGRLRIIAFFEGISLLILVFVAVPLKYIWASPGLTKQVGPVHGVLFLVFILSTLIVGFQYKWRFTQFLVVLLSSFVPFGTFYVDKKILSKTAG